jgi:hypothetical protein
MLARLTLLLLFALIAETARGSDARAICYLDSRWHEESRFAWYPDMVRTNSDVRRTITAPAELTQLRAILRLNRFRPRAQLRDDLCFVADIQHPDGTIESYYAGRFFVMSSDLRRGLRINHTGFRRDIDKFMGVRR